MENKIIDNIVIECKDFWHYWFNPAYHTPLYRLITVFVIGLFFSIFSRGFIFYVLTYMILALWQITTHPIDLNGEFIYLQIGFFSAGVLGFIIGRVTIRDNNPLRPTYYM